MIKKSALTAFIAFFTLILIVSSAAAQEKPIQLALFNPIQIFPEETPITGVRLSLIYGRNSRVTGLDWGLISHTTSGLSKGAQFGLVGLADADFMGWQNSTVNITKGNFEGFNGELLTTPTMPPDSNLGWSITRQQ